MATVPAGAPPDGDDGGFLSRWSRRKALVRHGVAPVEPVVVAPTAPVALQAGPPAPAPAVAAEPAPDALAKPAPPPTPMPPPTLADVAALTRDSDYARFVAPGVDVGIKNAALKKLFTDPHFNIMDRLDTYIDDYGQPDPLPAGMLRQMAQSQFLGLFSDEEDPPAVADLRAAPPLATAAAPPPAPAATTPAAPAAALAADPPLDPPACLNPIPDEDPDLRLQPNAAAGPPRAGQGAGPDTGRQH